MSTRRPPAPRGPTADPDSPGGGATPCVAVDANALERIGAGRDAAARAFRAAAEAGRLRVVVPSGVAAELRDPRVPEATRAAAEAAAGSAGFAPLAAGRPPTARQHIDRIRVRAVMRGDGRPGKHDADAAHLSDAAEAGCSHFVTQDRKILRRRDILRGALPSGPRIASLDEFMAELDRDGKP